MTVKPMERLRYTVVSRSEWEDVEHVVDIGSYRRHGVCLGRCTCHAFQMDLFPLRARLIQREREKTEGRFIEMLRGLPYYFGKAGEIYKFVATDFFRCPHITACRKAFFDEQLDGIVSAFRDKFDDYAQEEEI